MAPKYNIQTLMPNWDHSTWLELTNFDRVSDVIIRTKALAQEEGEGQLVFQMSSPSIH